MRCDDCGTRYRGGLCPNCHEEAYILRYQSEHVERVSDEFARRAEEQEDAAKRARRVSGRQGT